MSHHQAKMITALFPNRHEAALAYDWLVHQGYVTKDISILMSDRVASTFAAEFGVDKVEPNKFAAPGAQKTGAIGTGLAMVLAAGLGTLVAGIGLVTTGPIGLALAASIPGAMVGGLIGGLIGYGFPESSAKLYDEAIKDGAVAIGVVPHNQQDLRLIEEKISELHGEQLVRF